MPLWLDDMENGIEDTGLSGRKGLWSEFDGRVARNQFITALGQRTNYLCPHIEKGVGHKSVSSMTRANN